jgi:hypothetical protein
VFLLPTYLKITSHLPSYNWPTYLPTHQPTYLYYLNLPPLLIYITTYLPMYTPTIFYATYLFTSFTYIPTYLLLPIIQPIYLPTSSTYIHISYLPSYNLSNYLFPLPTYLLPISYNLLIYLLLITYVSYLPT